MFNKCLTTRSVVSVISNKKYIDEKRINGTVFIQTFEWVIANQ